MNIKKERFKLNRTIMNKALISMLFSIAIFYPFNPVFTVYLIAMAGIWAVLIINYKPRKNILFFHSVIIISVINLIILALMKYLVHHTLHINWFNISLCVIYLFVLILYGNYLTNISVQEQVKEDDSILFNRRNYDLNRMENYIKSSDILGINGVWGSGKSFLVSKLKERLIRTGKYIFIDIDLLTCNLDELQTILLNEMERSLYEHKIVATHSTKLKKLLHNNTLFHPLQMLLMKDDMSYSEALYGFMQEIRKLDETIIIIYEDVDRISNVDIVKKIFSISEKLASDHIKIIYQYDEDNLRKLSLKREFVEKYIPFVVNITPVSFLEIVESVLAEEAIKSVILNTENFTHLTMPFYIDHYLVKAFALSSSISLSINHLPPRTVRIFIKEIEICLRENKNYTDKESKELIINFFFIKHFFSELYDQFNLEKGLLDTITFKYKEVEYTISELVTMMEVYQDKNVTGAGLTPDDIKELFENKNNQQNLFILSMFHYHFDIKGMERSFEGITTEPTENIQRRTANEKKDRIFWNLLCNGKSEYTDYEEAAKKLIDEVLNKPECNQIDSFQTFSNDLYHGKFEKKDNSTIFLMGISPFISLSQALRVSNIDEQYWGKFIHFYFLYSKKDAIDIEVIQILNYCSLNSKEVYLDILNIYNRLKIIGNMNLDRGYKRFLIKYLRALSTLGYVNTPEIWKLEIPDSMALDVNLIEDAVQDIKSNLYGMKNTIKLNTIQDELKTILEFIYKIIEIAKEDQVLKLNEPKMHTKMTSRHMHQEEFERLRALQLSLDEDQFLKEIDISYKNGLICAYEIDIILCQMPLK